MMFDVSISGDTEPKILSHITKQLSAGYAQMIENREQKNKLGQVLQNHDMVRPDWCSRSVLVTTLSSQSGAACIGHCLLELVYDDGN